MTAAAEFVRIKILTRETKFCSRNNRKWQRQNQKLKKAKLENPAIEVVTKDSQGIIIEIEIFFIHHFDFI